MRTIIRLEEISLFFLSIYLFSELSFAWWYFPLLLFAPDVSIAAYAAGPRHGALVYNVFHHRAVNLALYAAGLLLSFPALSLAGIILFAHSSLDRVFGYGLKFPDAFAHTHLGKIGRRPVPPDSPAC